MEDYTDTLALDVALDWYEDHVTTKEAIQMVSDLLDIPLTEAVTAFNKSLAFVLAQNK